MGIPAAHLRQTPAAVDEDAIHLKVRITLHAALRRIVQPGKNLIQPAGLLVGAAVGLKLGDPHRAALGGLDGFADVIFEIGDAAVVGEAVPVDGDEVDGTAAACLQESVEPVEPGRSVAVAYCWGS